jgi:nitroimidazol reductase NimA-like FMN-containing flavoprotein (pyridoxamine 5'-phosphate oxidase superfamily)
MLCLRNSTEYESIILSGEATIVHREEERMKALLLLVEKYSSGFSAEGKAYAERSIMKTEIIRLDISEWSGKKRFRQ